MSLSTASTDIFMMEKIFPVTIVTGVHGVGDMEKFQFCLRVTVLTFPFRIV